MPHTMYIKVYDNSAEAAADGTVQRAPEWTKPILEAALRGGPARE
jgi:hypothetical protein